MWVRSGEDELSKRTRVSLEDKFKDYTLTLPVQIIPNCNQKWKKGEYELHVEGLGDEDDVDISISGITDSLCKEETINQGEITSELLTTGEKEETIASSEENKITGEVVYESSDVKARRIGVYFFAGVLIVILLYMIFKR